MLSTFDPYRLPGYTAASARNFIGLMWRRSLNHRRDRLGHTYSIENSGSFEIFRETVSDAGEDTVPVVLVVGFRLRFLHSFRAAHWLFQRLCLMTTPFWSGFPGFRVKLWMVDPVTKNYLGIYDWDGESNAQTYVEALERVLRYVSTPGSVWHELHANQELEPFLHAREV